MQDGWIKLHRKIRENETWQKEPFDKRSAWIDLLLRATHKEEKFLIGNTIIKLKTGQIFTSEKQLAKDWKWSRHKVRNFFILLEQIGQIGTPKRTSKYTLITIANWELYQSSNSKKDIKKDINGTSTGHQKDTYKNVKNVKEIKHIVEFLNSALNSSFRWQTLKTQSLINARLNEKRTMEDFELVIEFKKKDWENTEQEKYLRPKTLFTQSNFEDYLNQARTKKNKSEGVIA